MNSFISFFLLSSQHTGGTPWSFSVTNSIVNHRPQKLEGGRVELSCDYCHQKIYWEGVNTRQ